MALLGLTSAQAKFARWLIRGAETAIPAGLAWLSSNLNGQGVAPSGTEWRRIVFEVTRSTPAGTVEDKAQFKFDFINITADEIDNTWTTGDDTALNARIGTFRSALLPFLNPTQQLAQVRWYRMRFNPVLDVARPFADTGPPVSVGAYSTVAGTQSGNMPYQASQSVTLRTAWARHWGRVYLPSFGTVALDSFGRLTSTQRSGIRGVVAAMLGGAHDDGFYPVVPVGQLDKQPFHGLLGVETIAVDDIPDVQRRRRPKQRLGITTS